MLCLVFIRHKPRWMPPFLLIGVFVSNAALAARPFYCAVFAVQMLFYAWACASYCLRRGAKAGGAGGVTRETGEMNRR